jgi:hypothetical protein
MPYVKCFLPAVVLLTFVGCQNAVQPLAEDDTPVTPDTPLQFKLDGKNRVYIKDRWVELFSEHNIVVEYVKNRQEKYQQIFDQFEIGLPRYRHGAKMLTYYPIEVIVEVDTKTRSGAVSALRRVCREHGFIMFTVKAMDGDNPEAKAAGGAAPEPPPAPPGGTEPENEGKQ